MRLFMKDNCIDEEKNKKDDNNVDNNEIEVVIGDSSELNFSEVEDFVEALKPKVTKKSNIVIPVAKNKDKNKEDDSKKE